ncbi:hypothetical protein H3C61_04480 [Candidatus Gracilibacteria bacterium]|nr:hypothetical protein [Candidatus Gracilibacteria bacterium]
MKKFLLILFILFSFSTQTFAINEELMVVKYIYSPIITTNNNSANIIYNLQKGYILTSLGIEGDYNKVKLTSGIYGYILSSNLDNYSDFSQKLIENKGNSTKNIILYTQANKNSKKIGILKNNTNFYITHTNIINDNFLQVKIIDGINKNKIGYIENKDINIYFDGKYTSNISNYIANITNNKKVVSRFKPKKKVNKENKETSNSSDFLSNNPSNNSFINLFNNNSNVNIESNNNTGSIFSNIESDNNTNNIFSNIESDNNTNNIFSNIESNNLNNSNDINNLFNNNSTINEKTEIIDDKNLENEKTKDLDFLNNELDLNNLLKNLN